MDNWPNFFVVGAPKAGTTSLHEYLRRIPGIYMSPEKEPNFFSAKTIHEEGPTIPIRNKKKYLNLFKKVKDEKIIGESSPNYLVDPDAPKLIHRVSPEAKILISLRNPVDRLFSHYLMYRSVGRIKISFSEFIEKEFKHEYDYGKLRLSLESSFYSNHVKRYIDIFGKDQVKIIFFEELIEDTNSVLRDILKFLNVSISIDNLETEAHNPYSEARGEISKKIYTDMRVRKFVKRGIMPVSVRRFLRYKVFMKKQPKQKIDENDRHVLEKFYDDDVQKLKNILNRELPWQGF